MQNIQSEMNYKIKHEIKFKSRSRLQKINEESRIESSKVETLISQLSTMILKKHVKIVVISQIFLQVFDVATLSAAALTTLNLISVAIYKNTVCTVPTCLNFDF